MARDGELLDIAQTCRRLGIRPADIEAMEEEGLITLAAAEDGKALPSDQLDLVEMILRIQRDLNVNLPGVAVILEMRRKMIQMRREVDEILEFIRRRVSEDLGEILGEERFPLALGPGEDFLALGRGRPGRGEGGTRRRGGEGGG